VVETAQTIPAHVRGFGVNYGPSDAFRPLQQLPAALMPFNAIVKTYRVRYWPVGAFRALWKLLAAFTVRYKSLELFRTGSKHLTAHNSVSQH